MCVGGNKGAYVKMSLPPSSLARLLHLCLVTLIIHLPWCESPYPDTEAHLIFLF